MQLANESAAIALDVVDPDPETVEALNAKIRQFLELAVDTRDQHREVTFRLACALADFADVWAPKGVGGEGT